MFFPHQCLRNFDSEAVWMQEEIRRIGRTRFDSAYWPSLDQAIVNSVHRHSRVICDPNKDSALAGFVLVCPPPDRHRAIQWGLSSCENYENMYEIAFVAVDAAWEGKGLARKLLHSTITELDAVKASAWLHVDLINPRAMRLYESLGFLLFDTLHDPYGSNGHLMIREGLERGPELSRNSDIKEWPTLFYSGPGESEQSFCRSILAPPRMASCGHALPCLI
jgi:ribosomal protein S18 acetylase RimI-like enzyme